MALYRFSNIYFVDASATETIEADLRNIALAKAIGSSWEDTLDWLAGQHEQWLLLLNNADDTTFNLRKYFPHCSRSNILITTRNRHNIQHASDRRSSRQVSEMTPEDAKILLLKISGLEECSPETNAQAMAIVKVDFYSCVTYQCIEYSVGTRPLCARCGPGWRIPTQDFVWP